MMQLQKRSLAQELADTLQHSIERGVFPVSSRLPTEPELMKKFGVGRSTVREAIKYLAQSGFVSVQQGLGTFVISHTGNNALDTKIEQAKFAEIFEVRQLLEIKVVEKAATHRTAAQLSQMSKALKERKRHALNGAMEACIQADIDFHTTVAESCGNMILCELYKTLSVHVSKFFLNVYKDTSSFTESQELHESLLQYIKERNAPKALAVAQSIIGII